MEIQLANQHQHHIANLMWDAKDMLEVRQIIATYGPNAEIVFQMMMAAVFDSINDTDLAEMVLNSIK
jgi:hypothetical protein